MFMVPSAGLFLTTLVSGAYLASMSSSWFGAWAGLELNLLSFIPFILMGGGSPSVESGLKYFLVQACGSFLVLYIGMVLAFTSAALSSVLVLSLVLKSGGGPVHSWLPMVVEGLSWGKVGAIFSVQKLAPLTLLWYLSDGNVSYVFSVVIVSSALVGALGGINEMSLRKMLAFSSINHFGWLCLSMGGSVGVSVVYFMSYCFMVLSLIGLLAERQWFYLSQVSREDLGSSYLVGYSFMSLGGLPPFLGFFPKWGVLVQGGVVNSVVVMGVVIMLSLVMLFYYLRAGLSMFLTFKFSQLRSQSLSKFGSAILILNFVGVWGSGMMWVYSL
uniref:NADH-ubiquinone oxidoreductase chain 2 n=1 Tax=Sphaeroma serratum TaxID=96875 RepID=E3SXB8_SPHSR|nr:NADH dehydrogenase subunit 2 [Sphaeroma serratum]